MRTTNFNLPRTGLFTNQQVSGYRVTYDFGLGPQWTLSFVQNKHTQNKQQENKQKTN